MEANPTHQKIPLKYVGSFGLLFLLVADVSICIWLWTEPSVSPLLSVALMVVGISTSAIFIIALWHKELETYFVRLKSMIYKRYLPKQEVVVQTKEPKNPSPSQEIPKVPIKVQEGEWIEIELE